MKLPPPNEEILRQAFRIIEQADQQNQKRNQPIIITAPNGTQYKIVVDNAGMLSTVPI